MDVCSAVEKRNHMFNTRFLTSTTPLAINIRLNCKAVILGSCTVQFLFTEKPTANGITKSSTVTFPENPSPADGLTWTFGETLISQAKPSSHWSGGSLQKGSPISVVAAHGLMNVCARC